MKRAHIFVRGIVQGVFFRHFTQQQAKRLDIKGWVRNLPDGRVEILCEGSDESVEKLINWAKKGPEGAFVEGIDVTYEEYKDEFRDFRIIR